MSKNKDLNLSKILETRLINKMSWSGKILFFSLAVFVILLLLSFLLSNPYNSNLIARVLFLVVSLLLFPLVFIVPYIGIVHLLVKFLPKHWRPKSKFTDILIILIIAFLITVLIWPGITFVFETLWIK